MKVTNRHAQDAEAEATAITARSVDIQAADGSLWEITDSDEGLTIRALPHTLARLKMYAHSHNSLTLENTWKGGQR